MGSRSLDSGKATVSGRKHNKCIILPANENMVAEALEKRNQNWYSLFFLLCKHLNIHVLLQIGTANPIIPL
jgi:hypothetical protein